MTIAYLGLRETIGSIGGKAIEQQNSPHNGYPRQGFDVLLLDIVDLTEDWKQRMRFGQGRIVCVIKYISLG